MVEEASTIYEELGEASPAQTTRVGSWAHRILALNLAKAEAVLRDSCDTFESANNQAALSSVSSELAQALDAQSRFGSAGVASPRKRAFRGTICRPVRLARSSGKLLPGEGAPEGPSRSPSKRSRWSELTDSACQRADVLLGSRRGQANRRKARRGGTGGRGSHPPLRQKGDVPSSLRHARYWTSSQSPEEEQRAPTGALLSTLGTFPQGPPSPPLLAEYTDCGPFTPPSELNDRGDCHDGRCEGCQRDEILVSMGVTSFRAPALGPRANGPVTTA